MKKKKKKKLKVVTKEENYFGIFIKIIFLIKNFAYLSSYKRFPNPIEFDLSDETCINFITAIVNLWIYI